MRTLRGQVVLGNRSICLIVCDVACALDRRLARDKSNKLRETESVLWLSAWSPPGLELTEFEIDTLVIGHL